jgi:hypothetical protein
LLFYHAENVTGLKGKRQALATSLQAGKHCEDFAHGRNVAFGLLATNLQSGEVLRVASRLFPQLGKLATKLQSGEALLCWHHAYFANWRTTRNQPAKWEALRETQQLLSF